MKAFIATLAVSFTAAVSFIIPLDFIERGVERTPVGVVLPKKDSPDMVRNLGEKNLPDMMNV